MKRRVAIALSFVTILGAAFGYGQSPAPVLGRLNIPFKFIVRAKEMPAGKYELLRQEGGGSQLQLRNVQTGKSTFLPIIERLAETNPAEKHSARMIFDTVGDKKFVSEFWPADNSDGYLVGINKGEQEHKVLEAEQ